MKIFKNFIGLAALALCLGFASCSSDDDAASYCYSGCGQFSVDASTKPFSKAKGFTSLMEIRKMLLDDKANSTISLDLSGTKVDTAALKELSVFPNLKELNLSNNGYGETFDFSVLPAQITGIDLTNNDIYNYDNLVKVTVEENGDEKVVESFTISPNFICQRKLSITLLSSCVSIVRISLPLMVVLWMLKCRMVMVVWKSIIL